MEDNNNIENENNNIIIEDEVIATIAGIAVSEVPGVAEMSGGFAGGITEVLSGKRNLAKGIKVETKEGTTKIDVNIIVDYGVRIPDVAFEIQNKVKKAVEEKSGLKVIGVNVHIQGVKTDINDTQDIIIDEKNEENTIGNEKEQNKKEYLENFGKEEKITNSENNYYEEEEEKEDAKRKKGKHF